MRLPVLFLAFWACTAVAQEVARVFGKPVTAPELRLTDEKSLASAASALRQRVLKEAIERFVARNRLEATEADLAAYEKFESEFQRIDRARRLSRRQEIEFDLKAQGLDPVKRQRLDQEREVLASLEKHDAERASMTQDGASKRRVRDPWITAYKARKALYEKYGGTVAITKWGPDPVGATAALLREHEKRGEIRIADAALAAEFWKPLDAPPRFAASRPEHFDFTYYWLKPVAEIK